jgi:hypothetical protein
MNRFKIISFIIVFSGISFILWGCKKDKIKGSIPVITILGNNPVTAGLGYPYIDAGATAADNEDGNISSSIITTNTIDTSIAGIYFVYYNVTDNDGNKAAQVIRTVNVVNTK